MHRHRFRASHALAILGLVLIAATAADCHRKVVDHVEAEARAKVEKMEAARRMQERLCAAKFPMLQERYQGCINK